MARRPRRRHDARDHLRHGHGGRRGYRNRDAALRSARDGGRAAVRADLDDTEGPLARGPARVRIRPRLQLCVRTDGGVMRRIGIDVGGTNTDAVLIEDSRVTAAVKVPTTADVSGGIVRALAELVISVGSPGSI